MKIVVDIYGTRIEEKFKGSLRHPVSACVYRTAARFQCLKRQRIAFSAVRKIPIEIVPHCVKT